MRLKNEQNFTGPGKVYNEDGCGLTEFSAWAIDGATGLGKNIVSENSDAAWLTNEWNQYLKKNADDFSKSLNQIFKQGIREIKEKYDTLTKGHELEKLDKPSVYIAFARRNNKKLEYFVIGDCMMVVKNQKHTKPYIIEDLGKLDQQVLDRMEELYKGGNYKSVIEARYDDEIKNMLSENRLKLNTPGGYWVLSFDEEAIDHGLTGELEDDNYKILLMSDGYYSMVDKYNQCNYSELVDMTEKMGVKAVYDEIRRIEDEDEDCNKYTRFKKGDDTTCVYLDIEKTLEDINEM